MINVVISGAAGRLGRAISRVIEAAEGIRVVGAIGPPERPYIGEDLGTLIGAGPMGVVIESDVDSVLRPECVWVEVSTPEATANHAARVHATGLPLVVGTTGLTASQKDELEAQSRDMPCLIAPNTSIGANLLFALAETAARTLGPDFDVEIIEAHHRMKRDAPSGTAVHLAERISQALDRTVADTACYGREGEVGPRPAQEIGIHAVRAGDIAGEHTVLFGGMGERMELTHRVRNIDTFAHGAVQAIRFIHDRPPGLYTMADVIEAMNRS